MVTAIVGTIGSGKSTVLNYLASRGLDVLSCDEINRNLLINEEYKRRLFRIFPDVLENGYVNKNRLSAKIFHSSADRKLLNELSHPIIEKILMSKILNSINDIFIEIPLFNILKDQAIFDRIWFVYGDNYQLIERLIKRDNISSDFARQKINIQKSSAIINDRAFYCIYNTEDIVFLENQIDNLLS